MNTESVDAYLRDGCGRCSHYKTPACKVHAWTGPLQALRELMLACGLTEEMKWGAPCYTHAGRNVVMIGALKACCTVGFFNAGALQDNDGLLEMQGPNSRHARVVRIRSEDEVSALRGGLMSLVQQGMALAEQGVVEKEERVEDPVPDALLTALEADPELLEAFYNLTPGRRRSHCIHVGGALKPETRERRAQACVPFILAGQGFRERAPRPKG